MDITSEIRIILFDSFVIEFLLHFWIFGFSVIKIWLFIIYVFPNPLTLPFTIVFVGLGRQGYKRYIKVVFKPPMPRIESE